MVILLLIVIPRGLLVIVIEGVLSQLALQSVFLLNWHLPAICSNPLCQPALDGMNLHLPGLDLASKSLGEPLCWLSLLKRRRRGALWHVCNSPWLSQGTCTDWRSSLGAVPSYSSFISDAISLQCLLTSSSHLECCVLFPYKIMGYVFTHVRIQGYFMCLFSVVCMYVCM